METSLGHFNTLKVAKEFKSSGFTEQQAEALASKLSELVEDHLVTKTYLDTKLKELEYKMTIKLGTISVITIGIFSAIIKLL